ncbi:glycosyltransferase [Fusobacterium sp. SYSU M8D902]|uniref:glycosyltransferase n=2 Tax=unclassified Fusobacterium TaxID=2648384 RepID=UPI0032E51210
MKRKLIVHNGNISIGGQEKMLIEFLKLLDPQKYEVLLLIEENNGKRNDYIDEIPKWVEYKFLTTERFMSWIEKNKKSKNPLRKVLYSFLLKIKKKISAKEFEKYLNFSDIIIDYDMGLMRNLHKINLRNKKLIGWSHAGDGSLHKNKNKRKNVERYDYIVTINEVMKNGYEKNTIHPQILKIYNFMDFDLILEKSKEAVEENLGEYIISVGSLTENKNQALLIKSFSRLKKEKNILEKLVIIGEGKEREKLQMLIKNLNLENEVFLLGQKLNPYKYIANSKLFVLTSKNEGFSLTCIEAMILRKMVIVTETNGTREILGNKSNYGKLISGDETDLLNLLFFYLKNENERKKYKEEGYKRAKQFDKGNAKLAIEEFIDRI